MGVRRFDANLREVICRTHPETCALARASAAPAVIIAMLKRMMRSKRVEDWQEDDGVAVCVGVEGWKFKPEVTT